MKKLMFGAGAAAMLALAACTNEAPELNGSTGEGVTFTVNLPKEIGTRAAFGDGLQADMLYYAVYDDKGNYVLDSSKSFGGAISTNVSIPLANGMTYSVAFFACETAEGTDAPYSFNAEAGTFTANYANMVTDYNAKDHDAFFKLETIEVSGAQSRTVTLTRPVAQINWGTNDLNAPAITHESAYGTDAANLTSKVTAKAVNTTFDMKAGQVTDDVQDVVLFEAMARPGKIDGGVTPADFAVEGYDLVSTQYLLVPATSSVVDLEWTPLCSGVEKPSAIVTGAPVQANFRTNIYGALLSAPQEFEVIKDNDWGGDNNVEWGGIQVDQDGNYTITSPEGLVSLSNLVNSGEEDFKNKNVKLLSDLDMEGVAFNPIGFYRQTTRAIVTTNNTFKGTFDGGNHTISNLTVIDETPGFGEAALFGSFSEGTIKNVTVKNITAKSHHYAAGLVAHFIGQNQVGVIENCHVDGATIVSTPEMVNGAYDNGDKAGGLVGYIQKENNASAIRNCSVKNSTVIAYRDLGGLIGCIASKNSTLEISGNSVADTKVLQSEENAYKTSPITTVGEVIGRFDGNAETLLAGKIGCTTSNVTTTTGAITIGTAEQLRALEADSHVENAYKGKTIVFTADIDLENKPWTPMGSKTFGKGFSGNIDGNGHTIKNLNITGTKDVDTAAGFIVTLSNNACVKNLTFENVNIESVNNRASAVVTGMINTYGTVDNCHVKNVTIKANRRVGGIAGQIYGKVINCTATDITLEVAPDKLSGELDNADKVGGIVGQSCEDAIELVENCHVKNFTITGFRDLGGVVGHRNGEGVVRNCSATNGTITSDDQGLPNQSRNVGKVIGRGAGVEGKDVNNTSSNVEIIIAEVD